MSLVVWLPLTKDLRNQGLSNVTITNNGATFNSAGKLGGCYTFTNQTIVVTPSTALKNSFGSAASLACWVKVSTSHAGYAQCMTFGIVSGSWTAIYFGIDMNGSGVPIGNVANGSGYTNCSFGTAIKDAQWHHLALTYESGTIKSYMDGVLKNTVSTSYTPAWTNATVFSIGGNSSEVFKNGDAMNDVRLYNHCLSPMEVKELAKGLVLHYPLNRNGWGQENLLVDTYNWSTLTNASTVSEGYWYNNGGIAVRGYDNINNITYCKIWHSDSSSWTRYSRQYVTMQPNTYYTVSILCRINTDIAHLSIRNDRNEAITFFAQNVELTNRNWEWKFFTAKTHTNTSQEPFTIYAQVNSDGVLSSDTSIDIAMIKLEKGSIVTPWCPNSSDVLATTMGLNSTTEYDCSGFCNNGIRTGTFTWTSDTPKYNVSQYFNGSSYSKTDSGTFSWFAFDKCTVAIWMKPATLPSSWAGTFGIAHDNSSTNKSFVIGNYGGKFTVQSANGSWVNIQASNLPIDEWHHCVATLDGTTIKMYMDGELVKTDTINWGTTTVASDTRVQVGIDLPGSDEVYQGYYSDARIYAAALSADDVKSLYQNSAYIDSSGNIYGAVHTEV